MSAVNVSCESARVIFECSLPGSDWGLADASTAGTVGAFNIFKVLVQLISLIVRMRSLLEEGGYTLILSPVPIWEINTSRFSTEAVSELVVRLKLFEDQAFAEFTLSELLYVHRYKNVESLIQQFSEWHEAGFIEWVSEQRLHKETLPFSEYFPNTKNPDLYLDSSQKVAQWEPGKYFGQRKTPQEPWEAKD